jgi:predicted nucleic acid-binding protein
MANSRRRTYWDSCTFLGLLNQEPGKVTDCRAVWDEAENGRTLIYTSFWTFTEVYKAKCEGTAKPLSDQQDRNVEQLLRQPWIRPVVVDELIAVAARRLMRAHSQCKKPTDAVHLATACALSVAELHTFDSSDLLGLDGKVLRGDGKPLKICVPYAVPVTAPVREPHPQQDMYEDPPEKEGR